MICIHRNPAASWPQKCQWNFCNREQTYHKITVQSDNFVAKQWVISLVLFFDTSISLLYLLFSSQTNKFIPPMATLNVTAKSEELVDTFQDQMFYLISVTTTISKMETETAHICKRRPCRYRAQSWGTNHLSDSATRHKAYSWLKESYNPSPSRVYCSVRIHLSLHAIQFTPAAGHNGRAKSRNLI